MTATNKTATNKTGGADAMSADEALAVIDGMLPESWDAGLQEPSAAACDRLARARTAVAELIEREAALIEREAALIEREAALIEREAALTARVAELEAKTATSMGVGDGSGSHFVHGDYESIKRAQAIVLLCEDRGRRIAELEEDAARWADISRRYDGSSNGRSERVLEALGYPFEDTVSLLSVIVDNARAKALGAQSEKTE